MYPKIKCSFLFFAVKQTLFFFITFSSWRSKRASGDDFTTVHNEPKKSQESGKELSSASKPVEKDAAGDNDIRIDGIRIETSDREATFTDGGVPELMAYTKVVFRFFGSGFSERTLVTLTEVKHKYRGSCILPATGQFGVVPGSITEHTMLVEMMMPKGESYFYFCTKNAEAEGFNQVSNGGKFVWCRVKNVCFLQSIELWVFLAISWF